MSSTLQPCPVNTIRYNTSLCACLPGQVLNASTNSCTLFDTPPSDAWVVNSGVDYSISFPETTFFTFDTIKKFTQSQAVFLEATFVMLLSWLVFCVILRFGKLGNGRSIWFRLRWWISRLDICFATRHWLDDQKVVVKRKTELGGTFSIASWIVFIGLFAALLYQIISKRSVEVHNIRATNAPDLASFQNDVEFNITTVSSMSCSNLRGLGTLVTGNPGFIDQRVVPLSSFGNYSCHNTSRGPTISLKCNNCPLIPDNMYISWQFVDLPSNPATAVGFQFNLTAKGHTNRKGHTNKRHLSLVSGIVKNGSNQDDRPVTYRGLDANILKFNLFPQIYRNKHDLRLIQPLFHEFLPGSSYHDPNELQASLESSSDGLINTTLYVNFLSAYVIEIDNQNILGIVGFLADLGGLYCISIGIFFYLLVQCEYRIKRLRNEDGVLRKIRNRRKAQDHWDKLRKYVMYTWGCSSMDDDYKNTEKGSCCVGVMGESSHVNGSSHKRRQKNKKDDISFNQKVILPSKKKAVAEQTLSQNSKFHSAGNAASLGGVSGTSNQSPRREVLKSTKDGKQHSAGSHEGDASQTQAFSHAVNSSFPPPPALEFNTGPEISMSDIQKNLQSMYDYNVLLREKLVATQSMLHALNTNVPSSPDEESQT